VFELIEIRINRCRYFVLSHFVPPQWLITPSFSHSGQSQYISLASGLRVDLIVP